MRKLLILGVVGCLLVTGCAKKGWPPREAGDMAELERQFREMPMESRRFVQPLFWLHGDESKERLELLIDKMAESGCGGFVCESRPHNDFLGEGWYRDLDICLQAAKKHNMKMWIFDEKWWPSGSVGGKVPERYAAKKLVAEAAAVEGGTKYAGEGFGGEKFVAVIAGKEMEGGIDGGSLIDLSGKVKDGKLAWDVPAGKWQVMKFTWKLGAKTGEGLIVDGASQDCVDWYIKTVYQPHYDRFKGEFGKTIVGYFYDEPEVHGDWGTEVAKILRERGIDYKKALVAWKFRLAGEEQVTAKYQYQDAFFEAWGRTLYGGLQKWCERHNVDCIGHFIEHGDSYLKWGGPAPGNMFQMQKYSAMGGIDNVFNQFRIGERVGRDGPVFQTTKLGSSISHAYGKADDIAMSEVFGADGQDLAYSNMKWQADQHQVRGINFMVPHSFNPRAPYDTDCPPYFYMDEFEPRYPLFRVWADYTSRLSLLLTGGRHVAPVATIVCGNSIYAGKALFPDQITDMLDDIQYDSDWLAYDAFADARIVGSELSLFGEGYKVVIAPAAEVIPYDTLAKIKAFYDAGGIVIGYGILPSKSATFGKSGADIVWLREAIWGAGEIAASSGVCRMNSGGGRSYFLPEKPTQAELREVLSGAGVRPTLEVLEGKTDNWLHVLHRVKNGRDVFFIANQNSDGWSRRLVFRATARGYPECWDAMRGEATAIPFKRVSVEVVEFELTMEPSESALIVFQAKASERPARIESRTRTARLPIAVVRQAMPAVKAPAPKLAGDQVGFEGGSWVWYPEKETGLSVPPGTRYFRRKIEVPADRKVTKAQAVICADNSFTLFVNEKRAGGGATWERPTEIDVKALLTGGGNMFAIEGVNGGAELNPAGVIGVVRIEFEGGEAVVQRIDESWKCADVEAAGWTGAGFDDSSWRAARVVAQYGSGPWASTGGRVTLSPITADPFVGTCTIGEDVELKRYRVYLEMDELPDTSAAVKVNGVASGGVIGRPCRVEIGRLLKAGENKIEIQPLAPKSARVVFYAN